MMKVEGALKISNFLARLWFAKAFGGLYPKI
jgi:hypothetical protein